MNYTNYAGAFAVGCLLLLAACAGSSEIVKETDEYGHTVEFERNKETFAKVGFYKVTTSDGVPVEEAHYQADTLHGMRVLYHENGDTNIVEYYQRGAFMGPYRVYGENGKLKQEGQYEANELTGEWRTYHANGQLKEIVQFADNQENGPFVEYHENGQLAAEGAYKDGDNEHGELKLYHENGELIRKMDCVNGRCTTTWLSETEQ